MKKLLFSVIAIFAIASVSSAQEVALKWNALYVGAGALNVGAEFSVAPKWTISIEGAGVLYNFWDGFGKADPKNVLYANGWSGTLEVRWYTCEAFNGHHFGIYGTGARFGNVYSNMEFIKKALFIGGDYDDSMFHGTNVKAVFAGISYGYYWKMNHGWGLDFYVGAGMSYARFKHEGITGIQDTGIKFGVSRAGIALSYKF